MSDNQDSSNGSEFVPIDRAAMSQEARPVEGNDAPSTEQPSPPVDESQSMWVSGGTTGPMLSASGAVAQPAEFAAELPQWDLVPPVLPVRRAKRQL